MNPNRRLMTPRGYEKLSAELFHLKTVERPRIVEEISVARSHGDLSENAEYHFAKDKQGQIEGRILQLEGWLAAAEIIDPGKVQSDKVLFGATVELLEHSNEETLRYTIVGEDEADIDRGLLAVTSPLARELLGKEVDDTVRLRMPKGTRVFDIVSVAYAPLP